MHNSHWVYPLHCSEPTAKFHWVDPLHHSHWVHFDSVRTAQFSLGGPTPLFWTHYTSLTECTHTARFSLGVYTAQFLQSGSLALCAHCTRASWSSLSFDAELHHCTRAWRNSQLLGKSVKRDSDSKHRCLLIIFKFTLHIFLFREAGGTDCSHACMSFWAVDFERVWSCEGAGKKTRHDDHSITKARAFLIGSALCRAHTLSQHIAASQHVILSVSTLLCIHSIRILILSVSTLMCAYNQPEYCCQSTCDVVSQHVAAHTHKCMHTGTHVPTQA